MKFDIYPISFQSKRYIITISVLSDLEGNVVIGTEVSQVLIVKVGMALVLQNCGLIFLSVHQNLLDLSPGTFSNLHNVSIMPAWT